MIILFLGYKSHHITEAPDVIYSGTDAEEGLRTAHAAAAGGKYARLGKLMNPFPIPVALPEVTQEAPIQTEAPKRKK